MSKLFVWHGHHDTLCEFLDLQERIEVIRREKSDEEIPLRLRLMRPVRHPERLPSEWRVAELKREEAYQKLEEAYQKRREADLKLEEADLKWKEAVQKWKEAVQKRQEADLKWEEAYWKHLTEIEALHKVDCQAAIEGTCPWNGATIFPAEART